MRSKPSHQGSCGALVACVSDGSPAHLAGVRPGDLITQVNEKPVEDFLDFYLSAFERSLILRVKRDSSEASLRVERRQGEDLGILVDPGKPMVCNNKCIFCFVDQLPKGLRKDLYIKDEDYRLSFLHGNYITMTNLKDEDIKRIIDLHLSPIYVSVHATDEQCRSRLLGRKHDKTLLEIMDRLASGGIKFHCQIVLVPGYNTGNVLDSTIKDLVTRNGSVLSVSVVPVGLTMHRTGLPKIKPVGKQLAREVIEKIEKVHKRLRSEIARGLIYASDELFEIAGRAIPESSYYDDYPQIENGVGMLRTFVDSFVSMRIPRKLKGLKLGMVTAPLAYRYVKDLAHLIKKRGINVDLICIENQLLGKSVTVTGLLPGKSIIDAARNLHKIDLLLLPPNVINHSGLFIDGISIDEMKDAAKKPIAIGGYNAQDTICSIEMALGN